jgi:hypothetical protein
MIMLPDRRERDKRTLGQEYRSPRSSIEPWAH